MINRKVTNFLVYLCMYSISFGEETEGTFSIFKWWQAVSDTKACYCCDVIPGSVRVVRVVAEWSAVNSTSGF